jgi:hypothetical protein
MAYLMGRSPSNLGAFVRASAVPVLPQQRMPLIPQPSRFRIGTRPVRTAPPRMFPRFGLGQDVTTEVLSFPPMDNTAPDIGVSPSMSAQISSAVANIPEGAPPPPTGYPPLPAAITPGYTTNAQAMTLDPLNFVSPQAAIAAGADPTKTFAAWNKAVSTFATPQAAVAAGIPAGVVTSLFASSRSLVAPPAGPSWLDQSTFGIPNKYLLIGAGGIALLAASGGKRRR